MSISFSAAIYSPRWGHTDTYDFIFEEDQMVINFMMKQSKCTWRDNYDPIWSGEALERILQNDSIYPPAIFRNLVEYLWVSWRSGELSDEQANIELQLIISWLNEITKAKPRSDFWSSYF